MAGDQRAEPIEEERVHSIDHGLVLWRCPWVENGERCPLPMGHGGERHV